MKLGPRWNWNQKRKIQNWPWLRGDTARCEHQWQNDHFHWLPQCLSVSAHCSVSSCVLARHILRTRTVAQVMSLSSHPHVHVHVSVSLRFVLPFYFTHFLPHSFHFLLKIVDYNLLRIPHKREYGFVWRVPLHRLSTPTTSWRLQSSPARSSWTRRRSSPTKSLLRTPT